MRRSCCAQVEPLKNIFARAEVDERGLLSKQGLVETVNKVQAELSIAATLAGGESAELAKHVMEAQGTPKVPAAACTRRKLSPN